MFDPDTRLDHLMAAAIAKWGTTAVFKQIVHHVTMQAKYMPASEMTNFHETCRDLWGVFAQVRKWEQTESDHENQAD